MNGITGRIDVKNKHAQSVTVDFDQLKGFEDGTFDWGGGTKDKMRMHIGGTNAVGDGELNDVIGGVFNINKRSNDFKKMLEEMLIQQGNRDDGEVGISGVEIEALTTTSVTFSLGNGRATDTMTFTGKFVTTMLNEIAGGIDAGDNNSKFNILDAESFTIIGTSNAFGDLVGGSANQNDVETILEAAIDNSEGRIELISLASDEFSVRLINESRGTVDTFIFTNAADVITNVIGESDNLVDLGDQRDDFVLLDEGLSLNKTIGIGSSNKFDGEFGGVLKLGELIDFIESGDSASGVTVTDLGDSYQVDFEFNGKLDTVVISDSYFDLG